MAEYQLYCFAQSGNAYRAALMLNLIGADWQPVFVDFFKAGVQRTAEYRSDVNEMGEVPVLIHGTKKLSQSGVILLYLAERSGKFLTHGDDERLEALCWILFDNQKVGGYFGPYRFLHFITKPRGDQAVLEFLKGRINNSLGILDKRLSSRPYLLGTEPTIADVSLISYLYYPPEEFGFDIAAEYQNIAAWLGRINDCPQARHRTPSLTRMAPSPATSSRNSATFSACRSRSLPPSTALSPALPSASSCSATSATWLRTRN